jgi:hypothetical protein
VEITEHSVAAMHVCLSKSQKSRELFDFVVQTPFAELMSGFVFQSAIEERAVDVIALCLAEWQNERFLRQTLLHFGPATFAKVCPDSGVTSERAIVEYVNFIGEWIDPELIRRILKEFAGQHTPELEAALCKIITYFSPPELAQIFADSFRFVTPRLLSELVLTIHGENPDAALGFVERSTGVSPEERIELLCQIWRPHWSSDVFFEKVGPIDSDTALCRVVGLLPKLRVSEAKMSEIFALCNSEKSLFAVIDFISGSGHTEMAPAVIQKLLRLDGDIYDLKGRVWLYIRILKAIGRILENGEAVRANEVFEILSEIFQTVDAFPTFPIGPPDILKNWRQELLGIQDTKFFAPYNEQMTSVIRVIDQIVCK